jgi:CRP-like cAMP-binding protein
VLFTPRRTIFGPTEANGIYTSNENGAWLKTMPSTRAVSQTSSLPLRQNRLEVRPVPSRWRQSVELSQLFAAISPNDLAEILAAARTTTFTRKQMLFYAGEKIQRVILLTEGSVKITQNDEFGSTVILRMVGPGGVVGDLGVACQGTQSAGAEARVNCKALVWDIDTFETLSERFPTLQRNTLRVLAKSLHDLESRFCEISTKRVAQRLALELARLLPQVGRKVGDVIEINLSREELAQMTATTLFTVSRQLSLWEQQGIVSLRRLGVVILNPLSLSTISELK